MRYGSIWCCLVWWVLSLNLALGAEWEAGFARREITPTEALRLSGYASRMVPAEGTDTPLHIRCLALRHGSDSAPGEVHVLLSVDTIGFPASLTEEVLKQVQEKHGVSRQRLVVCCTHSHTAPHMGLENLFATDPPEEQQQALKRYREQVRDACVTATGEAITALQPARLFRSDGEVTFAQNRRVIQEGVWKGFGVNPTGPVDHSLPVLKITDAAGTQLRGILFNYACHCTTFGGEYNRVNGDWAGYAATGLEAAHPGVTALCTIGCGADQNPPRDPAKALQYAQTEGAEIVTEVGELLEGNWQEITTSPVAHFGFAGLPIDRPSVADLQKNLKDNSPHTRRHAEVMLATHQRMGRLPESYPMPVQVWRFGDEFSMVFLGGEVCVEYALRIKRELGEKTWVSAYANDVFAYVAPERMRAEGGYEVDFSMIYYLQPGRWSSGTEEVILKRVHELHEGQNLGEPLSATDAIQTFQVPEGYRVELAAAEPLIADPINFAFGPDGRLWVVEMGDYPRGQDGKLPASGSRHEPWDGEPGGRIKVLYDDDGNGVYDRAEVFAEGLRFPTGVYPWRNGALISGAPDLLFLQDTDGDGKADQQEVLYSGFEPGNPQHRINGFEWSLDGSLHLASGIASGEVTSSQTGETVNMSGRDLRIDPATGFMQPTSGRSQYGRCRDDFGNWYGNTNSEPLFAYLMEDVDLSRNPFVPSPAPRVFLAQPQHAPAVYPTSRTADRFNDLYAADRFTSACSPMVWRNTEWGDEELSRSVFMCEPVHNLISRIVVDRPGFVPVGHRAATDEKSEFLTSTDPWFRPVRLQNGPDGALWVCDMYRAVIEHPEWIPEAWQARIDLYAGNDRGRIYRIVRDEGRRQDVSDLVRPTANNEHVHPRQSLAEKSNLELVRLLNSPIGWQRDVAQRLLIERKIAPDSPEFLLLREQYSKSSAVPGLIQLLWTWHLLDPAFAKDELMRERVLRHPSPEIVRQGLQIFSLDFAPLLKWQPHLLVSHEHEAVRTELALRVGNASPEIRLAVLVGLAQQDADSPWMRAAILSSSMGVAGPLLRDVLKTVPDSPGRTELVNGLMATALGDDPAQNVQDLFSALTPPAGTELEPWQFSVLSKLLQVLHQREATLSELAGSNSGLEPLFAHAQQTVVDETADVVARVTAVELLGYKKERRPQDVALLSQFMTVTAHPDLQRASAAQLVRLGQLEPVVTGLLQLGPEPQLTAQALLLAHPQGPTALVKGLEQQIITASELSAATRESLVTHQAVTIREPARKLLAVSGETNRAEIVTLYASAATLTGDTSRGKQIFEKRCAACHKVGESGHELGPKLSALQDKSPDFLITAMFDPNRAIDARYRVWNVGLHDGRVFAGLITGETATSITLATADGRQQELLRRDIEELKVTRKSFMPEGLEKDVMPQDVADLMALIRAE